MLPKNSNLLSNARKLRREMTKYERHLWYDFLRYYPIKIYKQKIIGNYIADFYCHKAKLVIELDGRHHYTDDDTSLRDVKRMHELENMGFAVVRLTNLEIENNFNQVCDTIDRYIIERIEYNPHGVTYET